MHKYVAVMNKFIEVPRLMNALGHVTIALKHQIASAEEAGLVTYTYADGITILLLVNTDLLSSNPLQVN